MKRSIFLKNVVIGSTAALVGYPLFKAESAPISIKDPYNQNRLVWSNSEDNTSPYVDSNLWIRNNGVDILTEVFTNSGTIDPLYPIYGPYIEVSLMGIDGFQWPTGGCGNLKVSLLESGSASFPPYNQTVLYSNRTYQWSEGIMDSYTIDLSNYQQHDSIYTWKVECFTTNL